MPITGTLGALTYIRNAGTKVGNAWIVMETGVNNIQPGPVITIVSSSTDIDIDTNDTITFGTANDAWSQGRVNQIGSNGSLITGIYKTATYAAFAGGLVDSANNFYSCGQQSIVVGSNNDERIWVAKVNGSGSLLWQYVYYYDATVPTADWSNGIKLGNDGYLYIVGTYGYNTTSNGFLMKLDSSGGSVQWSRSFTQGTGTNRILGFDIDSSNNAYIVARSDTSIYIIKIDSSGNTVTSKTFDSGLASGVYCKGSLIYVAIDNGFIQFDSNLNIVNQYGITTGGSDSGLDSFSTNSRKVTVDSSDNIYISFPRVISGRHYLYFGSFDSSYNLRFCNRIRTTQQNAYNNFATSPTISGIKFGNNRVNLVYRTLNTGTNYMYIAKLPSDGTIPLNGKYKVNSSGFLYEKVNITGVTRSYTVSAGPTTSNITLTRSTATTSTIGAGGYTPITNL